MRKYLLDSDTLSYLEQQDSPFHEKVRQRLSRLRDDDEVMVSFLSLYEMHYGIFWASDAERSKLSQAVDSIANKFTVVGLSRRGASILNSVILARCDGSCWNSSRCWSQVLQQFRALK